MLVALRRAHIPGIRRYQAARDESVPDPAFWDGRRRGPQPGRLGACGDQPVAQSTTLRNMNRFACFISGPPVSDDVLEAHRKYLQGLLDNGTLVAAGPIADPTEGLVVFDADDAAAARAIADADPAVSEGGQIATVREWTVAFQR